MDSPEKTKWNIDKTHSLISFKVTHMMISRITGHFEDYEARVETDNKDFVNADFVFTAKTDSLDTGFKVRDAHLRSDDFFNTKLFPEMSFRSKSFDGNRLLGDLTIRDVTKEIQLDVDVNGVVVDPYGQIKAGFEIRGSINRKDFNLTWSTITEAGKIVVGDIVKLLAELQMIKE